MKDRLRTTRSVAAASLGCLLFAVASAPASAYLPAGGARCAGALNGWPRAPGTSSQIAAPRELGVARRNLDGDERRGGHTLVRHVGRSDDDLRQRLRRERGISAASTYTDRETAERVVAETLLGARGRIREWSRQSGGRPNLALDYRGERGQPIGRSLRRGQRTPEWCHDAIVVLRWDVSRSDFYVLTSYPEARR